MQVVSGIGSGRVIFQFIHAEAEANCWPRRAVISYRDVTISLEVHTAMLLAVSAGFLVRGVGSWVSLRCVRRDGRSANRFHQRSWW